MFLRAGGWAKNWCVVRDRGRSKGMRDGCGLKFFMTFLVRFWSSKNERKEKKNEESG